MTLIAATQRPTQKAMGQGALRSQMDIQIFFRVRERKDVDLVLGQGMRSSTAYELDRRSEFPCRIPRIAAAWWQLCQVDGGVDDPVVAP